MKKIYLVLFMAGILSANLIYADEKKEDESKENNKKITTLTKSDKELVYVVNKIRSRYKLKDLLVSSELVDQARFQLAHSKDADDQFEPVSTNETTGMMIDKTSYISRKGNISFYYDGEEQEAFSQIILISPVSKVAVFPSVQIQLLNKKYRYIGVASYMDLRVIVLSEFAKVKDLEFVRSLHPTKERQVL